MAVTESSVRRHLERVIASAGHAGVGWWVLNRVGLRQKAGQTDVDVLIGIPGLGLLVLEVKGWTEFKIESGKWSYRSTETDGNNRRVKKWVPLPRNPFEQSERTQHLLVDALKEYARTHSMNSGPLPKCESAVLFGSLSAKELADQLPKSHEDFALSRDDVGLGLSDISEADAKKILDRLRRLFQVSARQLERETDNGASRLLEVRQVLEPSCHVVGMSALLSEAKEALNHNAELAMSVRAESIERDRVYVEGPAGTGKTVLGLQLAARMAHRTDMTALYVCFSNLLAQQIREVKAIEDSDIMVATPESLAEYVGLSDLLGTLVAEEERLSEGGDELRLLLGDRPSRTGKSLRAYLGSEIFWLNVLEKATEQGLQFSAVIVDEAQDMFEPAFQSLEELVAEGGTFMVLCDPRQTTRRERAGKKWEIPKSVADGAHIVLETNLRNPADVISAVEEHCGVTYQRLARNMPNGVVRWRTYKKETFISTVTDEIEELSRMHVGTVVLHSSLDDKQRASLQAAGVDSSDIDSHKGLEWDSVVLIVGNERNPLDPNHEEVYVGMTRSRVHMTVIHHVTDAFFERGA